MRGGKGAAEKRLDEVRRRLEQWRRRRSGKSGRIPHELWKMAADVAAACGAETTATRLKLDLARLRNWMDRQAGAVENAEPTFVELPPLPLGTAAECIVELEEPSGRRLRIALRGPATAQALALSQMLWRAPS
jgi:hypothetical protein